LAQNKPGWHLTLVPIAVLLLLASGVNAWFKARPETDPKLRGGLEQLGLVYRCVAVTMGIWWIAEYIQGSARVWAYSAISAGLFLWLRDRTTTTSQETNWKLAWSAPFTVAGVVAFLWPLVASDEIRWLDLIIVVVMAGQQRLAKRLGDVYRLSPSV